jgi:hypothetical protein
MKNGFLAIAALLLVNVSFAQSEKYVKAMEGLVPAIDTTRDIAELTGLANSFERIANAEKTQWLPYYYAALCHINIGNTYFQMQQTDKIDAEMDKAEPLLQKAQQLEKNNSELYCLEKMFNTGKMMADPMSRYMTYGTAAAQALATAKGLDPSNPRVYLLEGIDKYYTPEQYGGSKTEGKELFAEAEKKMQAFKPKSSIHPSWGRSQIKYFLTLE